MGEIQRARLLTAAVEVVSELGYGGMSTARVSAVRVSRGRRSMSCSQTAKTAFSRSSMTRLPVAALLARRRRGGRGGWREQVRAGLSTLLQFIGDEPGLGALLIVDALSAGPRVLARRAQGLETLTRIVDQGRGEVKTGRGRHRLTAEGVVGAVLSVLHARMLERDGRPLVELLNPLMAIIVLPYLGPGRRRARS